MFTNAGSSLNFKSSKEKLDNFKSRIVSAEELSY